LNNAISQIEVGKRIGCIGSGIHHIVKNTNFNLLSNSFGHGINENDIFADPIILSKSQPNTGMRISDGMTFTIFPSLSFSNTTKELVCSFEKTVFVHKNHVEVITNFDEVN